jgi:hypothetical protein
MLNLFQNFLVTRTSAKQILVKEYQNKQYFNSMVLLKRNA